MIKVADFIVKFLEKKKIISFLKENKPGLCQIICLKKQRLIPRVKTKMKKDGKFYQKPIENMYSYLSRSEDEKNILILNECSQ